VTTQNPRVGRNLTPKSATVARDRVKRVDFDIDTGIR
jgi:hypothetical protein